MALSVFKELYARLNSLCSHTDAYPRKSRSACIPWCMVFALLWTQENHGLGCWNRFAYLGYANCFTQTQLLASLKHVGAYLLRHRNLWG